MAYPLRVHRTDQERWPQARFSEREWPPRSACIFMGQVQTHTAAGNLAHIPELANRCWYLTTAEFQIQPAKEAEPGISSPQTATAPTHCIQGPCRLSVECLHPQARVGDRLLGSCQARVGMDATRLPLPRCRSMAPNLAIPTPRPSLEGRVAVVTGGDEGKAR